MSKTTSSGNKGYPADWDYPDIEQLLDGSAYSDEVERWAIQNEPKKHQN